MKLAVEFPSVSYREGGEGVVKLAKAIEDIGYDQLDMFDHVVMGYPTATRAAPMYPPQMPILEALMTLAFVASHTKEIGLGTEVLVLPQRQPVLVAKQISTLDTLTGGRIRLGVGVGWQESEYDALEESFTDRGRRMDQAIAVLRSYWSDDQVDYQFEDYSSTAMAMEPKPPQGKNLPIWIGGNADAALKRVGEIGDGWFANAGPTQVAEGVEKIAAAAEKAGRDPKSIGLEIMESMINRSPEEAAERAQQWKPLDLTHIALNTMGANLSGVDQHLEALQKFKSALQPW